MKNIKIINGHNDFNKMGDAIYIEGSRQYTTIINCIFNNNWAEDYGEAIYNGENTLTIINCSFNTSFEKSLSLIIHFINEIGK